MALPNMSRQASYNSVGSAPAFPLDYPAWRAISASDPRYALRQENSSSSMTTVHRRYTQTASSSSMEPGLSTNTFPLRVRNENVVQPRTTSSSTLDPTEEAKTIPTSRKASMQTVPMSKSATEVPLSSLPEQFPTLSAEPESLDDIVFDVGYGASGVLERRNNEDVVGSQPSHSPSFGSLEETSSAGKPHAQQGNNDKEVTDAVTHPFKRWMSTLRRKKRKHRVSLQPREERWSLDDFDDTSRVDELPSSAPRTSRHNKSSSMSSSGFVTAVKSAGISLTTLSTVPHSRKTRRSTLLRDDNRSSRMSNTFNRVSLDENLPTLQAIDGAAWERAVQRRKTLEELITTEESYIADLKVLVNVYFTLLASAPNASQSLLKQIHVNITEILVLHEDLLVQLHEVIRDSDTKGEDKDGRASVKRPSHIRWHSVDSPRALPGKVHNPTERWSAEAPRPGLSPPSVLISEPRQGAEVARIFDKVMSRFFVYEEYGARYETMLCDMTATSKAIPNWHAYERGIEALANTLAPTSGREGFSRKGLTFGDLLIKPIQRICKYPLLFADLFKHTPVIDCPESHVEVEKILYRLRETAMEINKATNDQYTRNRIQRSWQLQDLLVFPNQCSVPFIVRSLGHSTLCGVLHVAYQSKLGVHGEYMLCALFRTCLILATPSVIGSTYDIIAIIGLGDLRIERTDNGRGLQCHTALYSWKIVFESDQQLFELIFSACSSREEDQWTRNLMKWSSAECQKQSEDQFASPTHSSMLVLDLRAIGNVLGQPGTLARRISIQRAATVGPKTNVCQVFIKNTHALQDNGDSAVEALTSINRSKSLLSTHRIPMLAPKRTDRIRMEQELAKVWTRELLPYPGMGANRGDHLIRASASSMMRKLSRASIASGFTKRSTSVASFTNTKLDFARDSMERVSEKDGTSSPGLVSYPSTSTVNKMDITGTVSLRKIIPPVRTSSANGMTRVKSMSIMSGSGSPITPAKSRAGTTSTRFSVDGLEKVSKHKWNRPIALIKSLSTEGMKGFFT